MKTMLLEKLKSAVHLRHDALPGFLEDILIVISLGLIIAVLAKRQTTSLEHAMHAESSEIRACMEASPRPFAEASGCAARNSDAAFHWHEMLECLPTELQDIGMTDRQVQITLHIICQKTYHQIAQEMRLDERTVRQHAASAFHKVGCVKRSEFIDALMERIEGHR